MRPAEPRRIGQERLSGVNGFVLEDPERHRRLATGVAGFPCAQHHQGLNVRLLE